MTEGQRKYLREAIPRVYFYFMLGGSIGVVYAARMGTLTFFTFIHLIMATILFAAYEIFVYIRSKKNDKR